jgi:hypothetical protein
MFSNLRFRFQMKNPHPCPLPEYRERELGLCGAARKADAVRNRVVDVYAAARAVAR